MTTQRGFHVTTTTGVDQNGDAAYGIHISQRHADGTVEEIVRINVPTQEDQARIRDQFLDLLGRLVP
jgi:hypothetical protein